MSLTRILKESWLFGKLQVVGVSEADNRAEEAARKVAEGLGRLQENTTTDAKRNVLDDGGAEIANREGQRG